MTFPKSEQAALLEQLNAERAISELVGEALAVWLPLAEDAVTDPAVPNPSAASDKEAQWDYLMDALVLYAVGIIAAETYDRAYTALSGAPLGANVLTAARGLPWARGTMPGMPDSVSLREKAAAVLRRRLGIDAEAVEGRTEAVPQLGEFIAAHLENVRGRVLDAARRVFRRTTEAVEQDDPVAQVFDPLDVEWQAAADEVGQTQATAALNGGAAEAAAQAAADTGRTLEIQWVAVMDERTREAHVEADGQRQPTGGSFTVGGEQLRYPGDPLGSPENVINCRCRMFAFFSDELDFITAGGDVRELYPILRTPEEIVGWVKEIKARDAAPSAATMSSMGEYRSFTSVLAVIGQETDDGRMFADDIDLQFRDFPLPLMWCKQSSGGHYDAYTVAVIEEASVSGKDIIGSGYFLNSPEALEAQEQAAHGVTGPSVDLGDVTWELRDENGQAISDEEYWDLPMDAKVIQTVLAAKVLAATLVSTPAFGQTSITLGEMVERGEESLAASALVAAAASYSPAKPSASAFANPHFSEPTLPHMTDNGIICGHLAAWNVCHVGIQDSCVLAPRSETDYAWFHTSPPVQLADGGKVKVGRLTVGGGHASPRMGIAPAIQHYDDVGTCFALVHVGEDEHGIWFSGIPAPGASPEQVAKGLSAPLSGDWRAVSGNLELVAALSVNTPGFPIIASGASDAEGMPLSLVASLGPCNDAPRGSGGLSEDQLRIFARVILEEQAAESRRKAEAADLFAQARRAEAAALIEGV